MAKPIEMIAWFRPDGSIKPIRFRIQSESDGLQVIPIHRIVSVDKEKLAGNEMVVFRCQSTFGGNERLFEIKYEVDTCRWILFKM